MSAIIERRDLSDLLAMDLRPLPLADGFPKDVKVGLVGGGRIVHSGVMPAYRAAGIMPVAVAEPDPAAREAMVQIWGVTRTFADYREMLDAVDLDVLDVNIRWDAGLSPLRVEIVRAAAQRGLHVIIAKAMAEHWQQCVDMVEAAAAGNIKLAVDHNTRYAPAFYGAGALIRAGKLGAPISAAINYHSALGRQHTNAFNAAHDVCVHGIDILLSWFDQEPAEIYARWSRRIDGIGSVVNVVLGFEGGVTASLLYDFATRHRRQFEFIAVGELASVDGLQDQELPARSRMLRSTLRYGPHADPGAALELPLQYTLSPESYLATRADLFRAIRSGEEPWVSGRNVLRTMRSLFALRQSVDTGAPVSLATFDPGSS
jgi:predicted dehydrogenase